jgi:hypothetical protein
MELIDFYNCQIWVSIQSKIKLKLAVCSQGGLHKLKIHKFSRYYLFLSSELSRLIIINSNIVRLKLAFKFIIPS